MCQVRQPGDTSVGPPEWVYGRCLLMADRQDLGDQSPLMSPSHASSGWEGTG